MEVQRNATLGAFATERPRREARRDEIGFSLFRVIRLVLPNDKPSPSVGFFVRGV